jgi:hypothetical protein
VGGKAFQGMKGIPELSVSVIVHAFVVELAPSPCSETPYVWGGFASKIYTMRMTTSTARAIVTTVKIFMHSGAEDQVPSFVAMGT